MVWPVWLPAPLQEPGPSSGERERLLATQSSVGGLREPPPSPTTSSSPAASSPAAGGPGDVPRPSRLAVTASAWPGPTQEGGGTGATAEAKEAGSEAELREAAAAEGLEQAAEGVKAEAAKGLQAEAAEGVEASGEEVGGGGTAGQPAGLLGRASSGDKAGTAEKALDRIDTAGSSAGEAAGPERALLHLETGTSAGGSDGGDVEASQPRVWEAVPAVPHTSQGLLEGWQCHPKWSLLRVGKGDTTAGPDRRAGGQRTLPPHPAHACRTCPSPPPSCPWAEPAACCRQAMMLRTAGNRRCTRWHCLSAGTASSLGPAMCAALCCAALRWRPARFWARSPQRH